MVNDAWLSQNEKKKKEKKKGKDLSALVIH